MMLSKYKGIMNHPELLKLEEMFQMQRALNNAIFKEKGITEFPTEKMELAFLDEIGELNHEMKSYWCYWKSTQKPTDNQKVLEEYVDCLHFILSLCSSKGDMKFGREQIYSLCKVEDRLKIYTIYFRILQYIGFQNYRQALKWFFVLGNKIGLDWDDIYHMYIQKNKVNYERLKGGY